LRIVAGTVRDTDRNVESDLGVDVDQAEAETGASANNAILVENFIVGCCCSDDIMR